MQGCRTDIAVIRIGPGPPGGPRIGPGRTAAFIGIRACGHGRTCGRFHCGKRDREAAVVGAPSAGGNAVLGRAGVIVMATTGGHDNLTAPRTDDTGMGCRNADIAVSRVNSGPPDSPGATTGGAATGGWAGNAERIRRARRGLGRRRTGNRDETRRGDGRESRCSSSLCHMAFLPNNRPVQYGSVFFTLGKQSRELMPIAVEPPAPNAYLEPVPSGTMDINALVISGSDPGAVPGDSTTNPSFEDFGVEIGSTDV